MQLTGRKSSRLRRCAAILASGLLLWAPWAQAQNFESYYGEADSRDFGEDVKSVNVCAGAGSVIVGTRNLGDDQQVQVTRVDNAARAMWQHVYNIAGSKRSTGTGITELRGGHGFAITGAVFIGEGSSIFVLQIDCDGNPRWTTVLDNYKREQFASGYDIIEGIGNRRDDLILVGEENARDGKRKWGRIARVESSSVVAWNRFYVGSDRWPELRFRALTENLAATGTYTDLVVAGNSVSNNGLSSALLFRTDVNGNPVCSAAMSNGELSQSYFNGVTALSGRQFPGQSVLVGLNMQVDGSGVQAYLARFSAGACAVQAQSVWNDPDGAPFRAYDVVEMLDMDGGPGRLILAGTRGTPEYGAIFAAQIGTLDEFNSPMMVNYFGAGREMLVAIDRRSTDRVVAAGSTFTDREGVGDPQDFYLVQADPVLGTQCKKPWVPKVTLVGFKPQDVPAEWVALERSERVEAPVRGVRGEGIACEVDPPEHCPGVINNGIVQLGVHPTGYLNIECPAISRSSGTNGGSLVGLRYMPTNGDAASPGTPCEGWGVASADLGATGNTSRCYGNANVVPVSFTYTPSTAVSVVDVANTFRVTHAFNPVAATPYLYRVDVSITNIGDKAIRDLRYTRGIDYDVPPNTFSEYITLAGSSSFVAAWNNNGFNTFNPLAPNTGTVGPFTDLGPGDQGAHIDFKFGALAVGATRSFVTYYGAAPTEPSALGALAAVGASVYSLGQANWDGINGNPLDTLPDPPGSGGYLNGVPATFMYGFDSKSPR